MAESVSAMDSSDEEDYYDVSDSFPDPCCEEGKNTPAAPQADLSVKPLYVPMEPSPPVQITVDKVSRESLSLHWDTPAGEVESYIVTCCSQGDSVHETTDTNQMTFNNLKPGECYSLLVSTKLRNGRISGPTVTSANTKTHLESLLEDLGLDHHDEEKLSLSTVLNIDEKTITDEPAKCNPDLPRHVLKKLMMVNTSAAVFVFFDALDSECELLTNQHHKAQIFLVGNRQSNVLSLDALNALVSPKNKILVVTVLGVQSTGKSTLLNTIFGVQFAVSSGRCTRGAFMLLIKINEDVKKDLNCDFMVIIDTEGLKSPELAQLDNSYEHDNELATLVVGLSDITIMNIAMENSTDMKDILQIVVHAFLRMKEVGKKPKFKQNDPGSRQNGKENMSFTDVMEYSPDTGNWYIPGLWNGNPPMAAVNAGYSEAVYELKKNIITILGSCGSSANNILEFTEWMKTAADIRQGMTELDRIKENHTKELENRHICGDAARRFQEMHEDFIQKNDPYRCLNKNKEKFLADFKDVFCDVDQCQKKAEEFTDHCLKPAVEKFVNRSLGPDIIGEMLQSEQFSTRMSFQYSLLLDLTSKDDFKKYKSFICSYESYVNKWILNKIVECFSNGSTEFEEQHLQSCVHSVNKAIQKAKTEKSGNVKSFVEVVCQELGDKLVISQGALGAFMILNNADQEQFAHWLFKSVKDMAHALREKFKETDILTKLQSLHVNPQNKLFNKLIGCGKQCPFCKAPCEAGGTAHTEHFASLHRPQAL
ncbi:hypothetical protein JOQ06_020287, partial [Pogonophryne albipinna]